jgi:hypothetical protein
MTRLAAAALALVATLAVQPAAAQQKKSADEVKAAIAQRYNVTVLRIAETGTNGRVVYRLAVMAPGGNVNGAFQVVELEVDAATGELVSQFRHRTSGYDLAGPPTRSPHVEGGDPEMRRETFRP